MWKVQRLFSRYRGFYFPIGLLLVLVCVFVFVIWPAFNYTTQVFDTVKTTQEKVDRLGNKLAVLRQYSEDELTQDLVEVTAAIPIDKSIPTLMNTVETVAVSNGVTLSKFAIGNSGTLSTESAKLLAQEEQKFGAYSIPFDVSLTGELNTLRSFLKSTATIRRFIRPKSFRLNFSQGNMLATSVSFDGFYSTLPSTSPTTLVALTPHDIDLINTIRQYDRFDSFVTEVGSTVIPKENPFAQ
jgi:Tfp pilus assembly protein PilO